MSQADQEIKKIQIIVVRTQGGDITTDPTDIKI